MSPKSKTPPAPEIKVGSVWKDKDPRYDRYVLVLGVDSTWVEIRTQPGSESGSGNRPRTRVHRARFHKRFTPANV